MIDRAKILKELRFTVYAPININSIGIFISIYFTFDEFVSRRIGTLIKLSTEKIRAIEKCWKENASSIYIYLTDLRIDDDIVSIRFTIDSKGDGVLYRKEQHSRG